MIKDDQIFRNDCPKGESHMLYHEMKIAGLTRKLPLCPLSDELNIGAFVIFGDVELTVDRKSVV